MPQIKTLKILVLHSLGNPDNAPVFLNKHVHALRNYFPEHEYVYHDTTMDKPQSLAGRHFDAIILDVTFLGGRWSGEESFRALRRNYAFIRDLPAIKLAFPQDEYDCNELLDQWMCDWNVDVVHSVVDGHWDVLFPHYSKTGTIRLAYTGYLDDSLLQLQPANWQRRPIDIGYRSRKLPPYFGRIGETKWRIGDRVSQLCRQTPIVADILVGDAAALNGPAWLYFLNSCKFTLGANSGSSLLDPRGEIQRKVRAHLARFPDTPFEEVERLFFPGQDGRYEFTAISPRVLEAAMLESCQILVEGHYSGLLKPWKHYIPIKADASDFDQVRQAMQDQELCLRIAAACKFELLENKVLHYRSCARDTLRTIRELIEQRSPTGAILPVTVADELVSMRYPEPITADTRKAVVRRDTYRVLMLVSASEVLDQRLRWMSEMAPPDITILRSNPDHLMTASVSSAISPLPADSMAMRRVKWVRALLAASDTQLFAMLRGTHFARVQVFRHALQRLLHTADALLEQSAATPAIDAVIATDLVSLLAGVLLKDLRNVPLVYDARTIESVSDAEQDTFERDFWANLQLRLLRDVDYAQASSLPLASRLTSATRIHFTAVPQGPELDWAVESKLFYARLRGVIDNAMNEPRQFADAKSGQPEYPEYRKVRAAELYRLRQAPLYYIRAMWRLLPGRLQKSLGSLRRQMLE